MRRESSKASPREISRAIEKASGTDIYMLATVTVTVAKGWEQPKLPTNRRRGSAKRIPIAAEHNAEAHGQGGNRAQSAVGKLAQPGEGGRTRLGRPGLFGSPVPQPCRFR
jgi:hypothetical protein